jgi:hypothetical protein
MSQVHSLRIGYVAEQALIVPEDSYWMTITPQEQSDIATAADAADLIDDIYDNDACTNTDKSGKDAEDTTKEDTQSDGDLTPKTDEEIAAAKKKLREEAKKKWGDELCTEDKSGDYTADVDIVRSHPDEKYTLKLSTSGIFYSKQSDGQRRIVQDNLPEVLKTTIISKQVTVNVDVKSETSVILPYPVVGNLAASWAGTPVFANDEGSDPTIYALHNTLYWRGSATGTITATYTTRYDTVRIHVPGLPPDPGSDEGVSPDCTVLAFYHHLAYMGVIKAPEKQEDSEEDITLKSEICGFINGGLEKIPKPTKKKDYQDYGCTFDNPDFYSKTLFKALCCRDGQGNPCGEWTMPKPAKAMDKDEQEIIQANHPDYSVDFVGIQPCGEEGCGKYIVHPSAQAHNCCPNYPALAWSRLNSIPVIAPGKSGWVAVTGGHAPYHWVVGGTGFTLGKSHKREVYTDYPVVLINAEPSSCGSAPVTVDDGCTQTTGYVRSTLGKWFETNLSSCPWSLPAEGNCSGVTVFSGIDGKYKVNQYSQQLWIKGDGTTHTYCNTCNPTSPRFVGSCFDGWHNQCGNCSKNYLDGQNCYIEPHYCTYYNQLGSYCFDHHKTIYEWIC